MERANCLDSGGAPTSTGDVSRERFTSFAAAAYAVTPTYLCAMTANFYPGYSNKNVHGRTIYVRSSRSEGVHRVPRILHASRPQICREIRGKLRRRQRQFSLHLAL